VGKTGITEKTRFPRQGKGEKSSWQGFLRKGKSKTDYWQGFLRRGKVKSIIGKVSPAEESKINILAEFP
jgi:hypothetical protein